ncbi:hypothetical protein ACX6XY_20690 [Streptomyces sp. O3]
MSEITGRSTTGTTPGPAAPGPAAPGPAAPGPAAPGPAAAPRPTQAIATVQESYGFACLDCGYSWAQSYDIEHYIDGFGNEFVMYMVNGERVPSPIARPTCVNCGGHKVRIMQPGRVSSVLDILNQRQEALHPFQHRRAEGG